MFEIFKEIRGIKAFISEKQDRNMKLFSSDFEVNRKKYLNKIGLEYENLVSAKLEHGNQVKIVKVWEASTGFVDYCDGLLSQQEDVILSVTVADCFPVFLFDPNQKVIGILHCGWRSMAKEIIEKALKKMQKNFGCQLNQILVGIGPGIQKCHFEVEKELKKEFSAYQNFFTIKNGKLFLDLNAIIVEKLISDGILKKNIKNFKECTFCNDKFWSYRRDGVDENGDIQAMMATISMN